VLNTNDVLGVYVQQSDLPMVQFYCNGQEIPETAVNRFRGLMYPCVSVMGGAIVKVTFNEESWEYPPAQKKYQAMMKAQELI